MDKKKWVIIPIVITAILSILAYAVAKDNVLTKTVTRVDNIEKENDKASDERKEIIKKLDKQNNQFNKQNNKLTSIETIVKLMAEKQGIRYD